MNLILFESAELDAPLPRNDRRAKHILEVLRRHEGDTFDAGLVNGPRGKAAVRHIGADVLTLGFAFDIAPPPPSPLALIIGLPRPQTARDILRDATTLGAGTLHFVVTEKTDPNYARSQLWQNAEWRRHVIAGAEQAFDTRIPSVTCGQTLASILAALPSGGTRLALDNYEASQPLSAIAVSASATTLAFGPERGWSATDRALLREHHFTFAHLGPRVLRAESAVIAALALTQAKLGLM